jgi:GNAT superfamily N-acetyltransferase
MGNGYDFRPVTKGEWKDFTALFGPRGACAGCWCMWWRLTRTEFERGKGGKNRSAMKRIVDSGRVPGILAYHDGKAVGWCSAGPREDFAALERSRVLKRIDGASVWSIVCFFVDKAERRRGLTKELIGAAARYARTRGASLMEGYPVASAKENYPDVFAYTGFASAFEAAGFKVAARPSAKRAVYRLALK